MNVALALGGLVLELDHARQLAERQPCTPSPSQLAVLDDVALHEDRGDVGIEPDREHHRRQLDRGLADDSWLLGDRERVQVDDAVEDVLLVLAVDPVPQRPQVVAEVDVTGRLDAREHTGHGCGGYRRIRHDSCCFTGVISR